MENTKKLTNFQAILFILIVMINKIILNFPKKIIQETDSGSLINLIYIGILLIVFTLLLSKLFSKFPGKDIIDISHYIGGAPLKAIIGFLFIIFLLIAIILVNVNFSLMLKAVYFKASPLLFIFAFFIIGMLIANKLGFKAIVKTNIIIMPFTVVSIFFIFIGAFHEFDFLQLSPVFGNNYTQTFLYGSTNIFAFSGISYLYLIPSLLKEYNGYKKISLISTGISWVFLFLSVLSLLLIQPFATYSNEYNSLYIITRLVSYGSFFQRSDALFIFLWILSALSYLSIELFLIIFITKKLFSIKNEKRLLFPYCLIILLFSLLFSNEYLLQFIENTIFKYGSLIILFGICLIILLIANIKIKIKGDYS